MSFGSMRQELLGIPGTNFGLVGTKLNEALAAVQNENVFSFQLKQGGWLTPGLLGGPNTSFLSPGSITVTPYTTTITADAVATKAWNQTIFNLPLITQQQIRVPDYSPYNIISLAPGPTVSYLSIPFPGIGQTPGVYVVNAVNQIGDLSGFGAQAQITVGADGMVDTPLLPNSTTPVFPNPNVVILNPGQSYTASPIFTMPAAAVPVGAAPAMFNAIMAGVITIDRPWMEPNQVNAGYMIYQCYFPALPGFKRWHEIRDTTNNSYIDWWSYSQADLSEKDAERINYLQPTHLVPYQTDTRPGSATYGQMLYELWPHPIMQLPYTFACQADWPALQSPADTVPYPLTEELVKMRAYEMLYLWKESQKGNEMERGAGANWQFLSQAMRNQYDDRLKRIRNMDRNLVDLYFTKMRRTPPGYGQVYGTVTGQASVGGWDS